jgi:hypothetical protein
VTLPELTPPYVGPRPFERADARLFSGREDEAHELLASIAAHQAVLLYAASGAGKTSLLNAAVIPLLEGEGFAVLPVARVRALGAPSALPEAANVYVSGLLSSWDMYSGSATAAEVLAAREHPPAADEFPTLRVVIVDQLEELFFLYPQRWHQREGFFVQLAEALELDPFLRVVLSLREDYVAQLDRYASLFPGGLRARVRVEPLRRAEALRAVSRPLALSRRSFAPGVAERFVDDLLTVRVDTGSGELIEVPGEFVEPVVLQVACHSLWQKLPTDVAVISEAHLTHFGEAQTALARMYEEAIATAAGRARTSEKRLRRGVEAAFITPGGTRAIVFRSSGSTAGIPNGAIDELEAHHLIRSELRAGARWYELIHDRLIEPIRASNERYLRSRGRFGLGRTVGRRG